MVDTVTSMRNMCVVEDDLVYQEAVKQLFSEDFNIKTFGSAEEFLAGIDEADIVLIDYQLPGKSGFELLQQIQKECKAKLILMSTVEDGPLLLDMINKGLRHYVIKDENFIEGVKLVVKGDDDAYWDLIT